MTKTARKRWSDRGEIENPKIDVFLDEIWAVCERHGMALSHEDGHGAFEVVSIGAADREWLMDARDCTKEGT
jgi:hypothetical protein